MTYTKAPIARHIRIGNQKLQSLPLGDPRFKHVGFIKGAIARSQ